MANRRHRNGSPPATGSARLGDLKPDPKNARKHGQRNLTTIVSALREVGAARSIVIDEKNVVLAGNATLEAAAKAGIQRVQVVDTDGDTLVAVRRRGLSRKDKARLALFDNRAAELADGWDEDVLRELAASGVSLEGLWTDEELAALMGATGEPGLTDPDHVPAPRKTSIRRGDMIALGEHRLLCGDATKGDDLARLLGDDRLDFVITSPPYNVNIKYRSHHDRAERDEYLAFIGATVGAFMSRLERGRFVGWNIGVSPRTFPAHQVVTLEAHGLEFYRQIVWKKSGVAYPVFPSTLRTKRIRHYKPNYTHELVHVLQAPGEGRPAAVPCALCQGGGKMAIRELPAAEAHETVQLLVNGGEALLGDEAFPDRRYQNDVWEIHQSQATTGLKTVGERGSGLLHGGKSSHRVKEHPAPFPVEVPRALMSFLAGPGERVYDPFGGSGSTLIACQQLKRRARLMEIDPVYCQIVVDRWEAFTGQQATRRRGGARG